jgi:hypothetical protein
MSYPHLIESTTKHYIFNTLQQCHNNRVNVYYYALNVGVFIFIILVFGGTLYICSRKKVTDQEKQQKMLKDQQYILSKIRYYQEDKKQRHDSQGSNITDLPIVNNTY